LWPPPGSAGASRRARLARTITTLYAVTRREQLTLLAAAVAYYAIVSIVPLSALAVAVLSGFDPDTIVAIIATLSGGSLPPATVEAIRMTLTGAVTGRSTTLVGIAVLLWSGLRVFRALDRAFARLYGAPTQSLRKQVLTAVVVLSTMSLAGLGVAAVSAILSAVGPLASTLGTVGLPVGLTVVLLPLYLVAPERRVGIVAALPGAAVAAGGWALFGLGFRLYVRLTGPDVYGLLGALLLAVTWLYVASLLVLLGAAVNATLAGTYNTTGSDTANDGDPA
jgi:YihY family inner membrane protein